MNLPQLRDCSPEWVIGCTVFCSKLRKRMIWNILLIHYTELCCDIQHAFPDGNSRTPVNTFAKRNPRFFRFYHTLASKLTDLQSRGIGTGPRQADIICLENENRLWQSGQISVTISQHINTKCFGIHSGDERFVSAIHSNLKTVTRSCFLPDALIKTITEK